MGEALDDEMDGVMRQTTTRKRTVEQSDPVENTEHEASKEHDGNKKSNATDAEPWAEELRVTWLGFSPGV